MSQRVKELTERFEAFNNEIIGFVENCSDDKWRKTCSGEGWTVNVVARHIAASHYGALGLVKMIVSGETLPELTTEAIDQGNVKHAKKHADCTKDEVLGYLNKNCEAIAAYLTGLNDEGLDRYARLALTGGDISAQQFIESIIIQSGNEHLNSMKAATGVYK
jgi:hypothetical protein